MEPGALPSEAWDVIFKSGNAAVIVLGVLWWRTQEQVNKLATEIAVLKEKLKGKGE